MLTIAIQAGGNSSRMGREKAFLEFAGKPLIQHVLEQLQPVADEILITGGEPGKYRLFNARLCADFLPQRGGLVGLYTALSCATHSVVGIVACDMPFASPRLFKYEARLLVEEGWDVVIPSTPLGLEPLHAVYCKEGCLAAVQAAIQLGKKRLISWHSSVRVRGLSLEEIAEVDPSQHIFFNINTEDDLIKARMILVSQNKEQEGDLREVSPGLSLKNE